MVVSCVDVACQDRHGQRPGLGFFVSHFYLIEESWINAVEMNNWNHLCIPESGADLGLNSWGGHLVGVVSFNE